jgi:hypothetical protein
MEAKTKVQMFDTSTLKERSPEQHQAIAEDLMRRRKRAGLSTASKGCGKTWLFKSFEPSSVPPMNGPSSFIGVRSTGASRDTTHSAVTALCAFESK